MDAVPPPPDTGFRRLPTQPGWAVAIAWVAVAVVVAVVIGANVLQGQAADDEEGGGISLQFELTGKMMVGLQSLFPGYEQMLLGQVEALTLSAREELCRAIIVGELLGPTEALDALPPEGTDEDVDALATVLRGLYRDLEGGQGTLPSLGDADRTLLRDELGWFGELAEHAKGTVDEAGREDFLKPLQRVPAVLVLVVMWLGACALGGGMLLLVMIILASVRKLRHGFGSATGAGRIYGETFAIWFVTFFCIQGFIGLVVKGGLVLVFGVLGFVVSLVALAWPVVRGVPWQQVRRDVGLTWGRQPILEPVVGGMTYVAAVPLLLAGAVVFWIISLVKEVLFPGGGPPSHPAADAMTEGGWSLVVVIFVLGCIAAPIVEETMFRGVLYRHLREATRGAGFVASLLLSAVFSSFLFAAIHPQGLAFAPVLTGLAVGFCLAREWRGTLVPCIVAHAFTNAFALTLNLVIFRGL
jgi:membrane protease YdiL (CAAX protease family)